MTDLISELERAEAGSRELDCQIHEAIEGHRREVPHYTTSLDAALALVPIYELGEWRWRLHHPGYENGKLMAPYLAEIHHPVSSGGGPRWKVFAATPALALTIAALKAREA